ncbi:MAG TPA: alpha/beta hydrolase [Gaiellaceae bacterium]|nr:alpha/beta hydrolase [Gaiellaceae bacterium]
MAYVTRDGLRLYYEQHGSGSQPFVFVHGWCCDHTFFAPQFEYFGAKSSVTTYDLRGCGRSDPGDDYEIATFAEELAWLCRELGIAAPVIVGHSLGGLIALELAARHSTLPAAVVAVDPGPIDPLPTSREALSALAAQVGDLAAGDPRRAYVAGLFRPGDDAERALLIQDTMCAVPREIAAAMLDGYLRWDGVAALNRCSAPVLVTLAQTGGSNDPTRLLALKPELAIGVTVGAGHFQQLDAADQLTPMIERFVAELP